MPQSLREKTMPIGCPQITTVQPKSQIMFHENSSLAPQDFIIRPLCVPLLSGCLETKLFLHRASWKIQENAEVNNLNQQNARSKV